MSFYAEGEYWQFELINGTKFLALVKEDWKENWRVEMPKSQAIRLVPKSAVAHMELVEKKLAIDMIQKALTKGSPGSSKENTQTV